MLCGGIGTYEAVWAGVLLIIFHAVAKCLLFLCVGVVEHKLHSRNIEDMSGLVLRMPRVAVMMQIGMAGMFLAPFGMLISKWAVLKAVVDAYPLAVGLHRLRQRGHAVLLGQMDGQTGGSRRTVRAGQEGTGSGRIDRALRPVRGHVLACLFFPLISSAFIEPYVAQAFTGQCRLRLMARATSSS